MKQIAAAVCSLLLKTLLGLFLALLGFWENSNVSAMNRIFEIEEHSKSANIGKSDADMTCLGCLFDPGIDSLRRMCLCNAQTPRAHLRVLEFRFLDTHFNPRNAVPRPLFRLHEKLNHWMAKACYGDTKSSPRS